MKRRKYSIYPTEPHKVVVLDASRNKIATNSLINMAKEYLRKEFSGDDYIPFKILNNDGYIWVDFGVQENKFIDGVAEMLNGEFCMYCTVGTGTWRF